MKMLEAIFIDHNQKFILPRELLPWLTVAGVSAVIRFKRIASNRYLQMSLFKDLKMKMNGTMFYKCFNHISIMYYHYIIVYYHCISSTNFIVLYNWECHVTGVKSIHIMHIREVVHKNYSPRGNLIKVWNTQGWKPSVFWIFIKLPRVDNFTNDRSPNVHYFFNKMVSKIWVVVSKN